MNVVARPHFEKVRSVGSLFGPTSPVKFGPFTNQKVILRHAQPCSQCNQACLHSISVEECAQATLQLYAKTAPLSHRLRTDADPSR